MTPKMTERLSKLEAKATPETIGRHLTFKVEAPSTVPSEAVTAFLRSCGHVIADEDDVFVLRIAVPAADAADPAGSLRDLTPALVTAETRARAPRAGAWPPIGSFTFQIDRPSNLQ